MIQAIARCLVTLVREWYRGRSYVYSAFGNGDCRSAYILGLPSPLGIHYVERGTKELSLSLYWR